MNAEKDEWAVHSKREYAVGWISQLTFQQPV